MTSPAFDTYPFLCGEIFQLKMEALMNQLRWFTGPGEEWNIVLSSTICLSEVRFFSFSSTRKDGQWEVPSGYDPLTWCWVNVGPVSWTLGPTKHWLDILRLSVVSRFMIINTQLKADLLNNNRIIKTQIFTNVFNCTDVLWWWLLNYWNKTDQLHNECLD